MWKDRFQVIWVIWNVSDHMHLTHYKRDISEYRGYSKTATFGEFVGIDH